MKRWLCSLGLSVAFFSANGYLSAAPAAGLSLTDTTPRQGETVEVTVNDPASSETVVHFNKGDYKLFPTSNSSEYKALLAIPADLDPGTYKLKVGEQSVPVRVLAGKFPLQHLSLPPAKDNFDMAPGEEEAVDGAKSTVSPDRIWTANFVKPSKFRMSTLFGVKRVVNGHMLKDYFHSGLDFAAPMGSPVVSTADGTVVLAAKGFKLHGNCVAVDHGQGVVSFYIHLKTLNVVKGQRVKAGEKIGAVGSTGRANGPHLHFSIYVNKVAANPSDWFQKSF